jgi:hypothetical protein
MWETLFRDRKWRVAEEFTGTVRAPGYRGIKVTFARGRFELPPGVAFQSPVSTNMGRRGVLLVETSADGSSDLPGSRLTLGEAAVKKAREQFSAVW